MFAKYTRDRCYIIAEIGGNFTRLEEARRAYEAETEPARKRIKGGMLAAALFNRATDILTKLDKGEEP